MLAAFSFERSSRMHLAISSSAIIFDATSLAATSGPMAVGEAAYLSIRMGMAKEAAFAYVASNFGLTVSTSFMTGFTLNYFAPEATPILKRFYGKFRLANIKRGSSDIEFGVEYV